MPHFQPPSYATTSYLSTPYFSVFQPHGSQPYYIKMLTKQIRVCAGCRFGYNNDIFIPNSPYNIVIAHEEPRQVTPKSGDVAPFTTKSTVHYHANPSCIWTKDQSFVPENI
jgi:hypothetical protein